MKLFFVSGNEGKVKEAQAILEMPIEIAKIDLDEIQSLDVEQVAHKKAESAFAILKKPLLVDDVAVYVHAWKGFPGPFIKYLREAGGNELFLHMLQHESDKTVLLKAAIGYHDGEKIHTFVGEINGTVVSSRGERGWGFDPIIIPEGHTKTFAQMTEEEKNAVSHRRQAFEKLKDFLRRS